VHDVASDLAILTVKSLENLTYFLTLSRIFGRTWIDRGWKAAFLMKTAKGFRIQESQRPDHFDFTTEEGLPGEHSGYLRAVENIHDEGFNKVIQVVAKGDLIAAQSIGLSEKLGATKSGAEKAGILPVL
jgi:hypothetical protein